MFTGGEALAFCQPGDEMVCFVNGVQGMKYCGSNGMYGVCNVPPPPEPPTFRVKPKYKVLTVVYAPPGTQGGGSTSSVTYGSGSSSGSTVSTASAFKQSYGVTASTGAGFLGSGGEIAASFSYARNSSDTKAIEIEKTGSTQISHSGPAIDGLDHDRDQIWLWLNPQVDVTIDTNAGTWGLVSGTPMDLQYVYVGHLKNPALMPPGVAQRLAAYGITTTDYPEILKADPYANGTPALNTSRYKSLLTTFPYEPPFAPGDSVPTYTFNAAYTSSATTTRETSNEYSTGLTVTGTANLQIFKAKLVSENKWTWTDTDTRATSGGTSESAQVTVGGPSFGYTGPTAMAVYYDVIYKSFLFAPVEGPLLRSVQGTVKNAAGAPVAGREVVLSDDKGVEYRTFTNSRGEYRFYDDVAGALKVRSATTQKSLAGVQRQASVDLVVP